MQNYSLSGRRLGRQALLFPLCLVLYEFSTYIGNDMIQPGMLAVVQEFQVGNEWVPTSMTAYLAGGMFLQWLLGPLSDRIGRRPVMLTGVVWFIVTCLATLLAQTIEQFTLLRFLQGISLCFIGAVGYAAIQESFEEAVCIKITALMANVALIAPLLGPLVGAAWVHILPWEMMFVLFAVLAAISFFGLQRAMPETATRLGEKLSVKVDGKRVKQGKWDSRELEGGEKVTVKDGRNTYEKHEIQATVIEPKLKVEGTGAIEYVQTWGVQGRSEVWVGEQSGKTQDRGEVVPATDCVVACASVAPKGNKKYVALTFDEGPSGATKQILQVLKEKGVTATFFLSGDAAEASPATAKAIVDAGCEIVSNGYSDDSLKGQDREAVREQITKGTDAIKSATGVKTMLLRAPYAAFDEQNWIDAMDLVSAVVSWNIDSGDWLLNGADEQVSTVLDSVTPGNIVLFTDRDECAEQTLEALPQIIDGLIADGYKIVTLSDLVKTDTSLSKKLTSLTKATMPKDAVFPQLAEDDDTTE